MGSTHPKVTRTSASFEDWRYRPLLLPALIFTYRLKGIRARVILNGQTGEVQDEYPIPGMKAVWGAIGLVTILGGMAAAFGLLGWISNTP